MFFTAELLQKRDSGFGLLWLAATLGSQSAFKKLPKRSVLSADISELCGAIAEPSEPLALRLSSNLMVGVVRVYKVKQEILMNDVTTCSNTLRRMLHDVLFSDSDAANLQMAQPALKPGAVTLAKDPQAAFALEFDNLIADWDEYLNVGEKRKNPDDDGDGDYSPSAKRSKGKEKKKAMAPPSSAEKTRTNAHTLQEFHDHLLSNPFDVSFTGSTGFAAPSSQMEDSFGFNDFDLNDNALDLGALDDDILRELGEGWGAPATAASRALSVERDLEPLIDPNLDAMDVDLNTPHDGDFSMLLLEDEVPRQGSMIPQETIVLNIVADNRAMSVTREPVPPAGRPPSPTPSFTRQFLSQEEPEPFSDITNVPTRPARKQKRTRLLLDARTELTDEELKMARAHYVQEQNKLREEIRQKQVEKESTRLLEEMVWGVPPGMNAPGLVDFWKENCQILVKPGGGMVGVLPANRPIRPQTAEPEREKTPGFDGVMADIEPFNPDADMWFGMDIDTAGGTLPNDPGHRRSSEDPEQGRHASRAPSAIPSDIAFLHDSDSQVKRFDTMFPWDNAIGTSSGAGSFSPLGQNLEIDGNVRLRSSPPSQGSLSQVGSGGLSPRPLLTRQSNGMEEFEFEVPASAPASAIESQGSSLNVATLEKNSSNFLEYAKMQYQSLQTGTAPGIGAQLMLEHIVPKDTCTRHVAAAAFYHCLMLTTKDLIRVRQEEAYGPVSITVL